MLPYLWLTALVTVLITIVAMRAFYEPKFRESLGLGLGIVGLIVSLATVLLLTLFSVITILGITNG